LVLELFDADGSKLSENHEVFKFVDPVVLDAWWNAVLPI